MSQYKTGTATVTNNSPTVTGTNTLWLANVTAGDSFTVAGDGVMYDVASVDSDTQVTLSAPYAGTTASGAVYAIGTGFTVPDSFPEMSQGDIETATIFTRAMRGIQAKFNSYISDFNGKADKATTFTKLETVAEFNQYGLGASSGSLNDANDMVTPGTYGGPGQGGVNFPGQTKYGMLRVSGRVASAVTQEALFGGYEFYVRYTNDLGASWTDWEELYHTGMNPNFPNMPQVGGDPIVESGSNADGEFTKWADGTQICHFNQTVTDQSISGAYGSLYQGSREWTFPVAFIVAPAANCGTGKWGTGAGWSGIDDLPSTTSVLLRFWDIVTRSTGTVMVISSSAIGRWK